jgi:hypothetical protein
VKKKRFFILALVAATAISPYGARAQEVSLPQPTLPPLDGTLPLKPCHDPWQAARERWMDIADNPYNAFSDGTQKFDYSQAQVTLHYAKNPPVPYFLGRIQARGLKPNFSYQLKLMGKPQKGVWGWGAQGDEWANEQLGFAGRWFCGHPVHRSGTNFDDNHWREYYQNALPGAEHNIGGYIFMGEFVTDGQGNADMPFWGEHPYHIKWLSWQGGAKDVWAGQSVIETTNYAYGKEPPPPGAVSAYYENEPGRTQPLTLAPGTYNTRFVITEESFHNPVSARGQGGYWKTVLASEDYQYNAAGDLTGHDTNAANDLVFTIGNAPEMREMKVTVTSVTGKKHGKKWKATAQVVVLDRLNRPMRDVLVQGVWTGPANTVIAQGRTGGDGRSDGLVWIDSPEVEAQSGDVFQFTVSKVVKEGRTWNHLQFPAAAAKVP